MVNSGERRFSDDQFSDAADQSSGVDGSADASSSGAETPAMGNRSISRRLTDIFLEDGDEDLLMQRSDVGDGSLQWLEALEMQVMGACRADERLKPLLKLNISGCEAEDRLLAQLCEHFEPSEVGLLARCLCAPLVSIRVGKINKQGKLLCPSSMRGNLSLMLLPTSDLRISFIGDDGSMERLATISREAQSTSLEIEEIYADKSGRSFLLRIADYMVCYYWCSEKSLLLGREMLRKMKDLLIRKPTLAELTGISDDRLTSFATQLKACLGRSVVSNAQSSGVLPSGCPSKDDSFYSSQSSFNCEKMSQFQQDSCQGSTSLLKSLSSSNITATERLSQAGHDVLPNSSSLAFTNDVVLSNADAMDCAKGNLPETNLVDSFGVLNFVDTFGKPLDLPPFPPFETFPSSCSSPLSPQYCWCPPVASTLHYSLRNSRIPSLSTESFLLPPLSTLLSAGAGSSKSSRRLSEVSAMDFPSFQAEPLITSLPTSQQIPRFKPLTCDPIVPIPIYSSGPSYLVSAGPAIATTIPPLNLNLGDPPLVPTPEPAVVQSARETLCMLINSTNSDEKPNAVSFGGHSGGFYLGPTNTSFTFLSEKLRGGGGGGGRGRTRVDDDSVDKQDTDSSGFDI